ncbi:MAG: type II CAAX endopeptidase family protein [Planctomycetota bacterium]
MRQDPGRLRRHGRDQGAATVRFCSGCGRSLARRDNFCGACGVPSAEALDAARAQVVAEHARSRRMGEAMALVFVGVLAAVLGLSTWGPDAPSLAMTGLLGAELGIGAAALQRLGWHRWRASLGRMPTAGHLACALPVAAASLAVAFGYTALLRTLVAAPAPEAEPGRWLSLSVLLGVLLVPVCEEWLCRGVLWIAVRPVASAGVTLCVTAALFALLHGLNGGYLLEVPHRFVGGLLFGWLRARSGSLLPSVVAHALHNGVASIGA